MSLHDRARSWARAISGCPRRAARSKLAPVDGKLEARFRGPHVMAGYWRMDAERHERTHSTKKATTVAATRYALSILQRPELGLMFDGRIAEDFKLEFGNVRERRDRCAPA